MEKTSSLEFLSYRERSTERNTLISCPEWGWVEVRPRRKVPKEQDTVANLPSTKKGSVETRSALLSGACMFGPEWNCEDRREAPCATCSPFSLPFPLETPTHFSTYMPRRPSPNGPEGRQVSVGMVGSLWSRPVAGGLQGMCAGRLRPTGLWRGGGRRGRREL